MDELGNLKIGDCLDEMEDYDGVQVTYFNLILRWGKTDQDANGTYCNLYDNVTEPELMDFTRIKRWMNC